MQPHKREDREELAPPCQARLTAYVDGELSDEERARLEAWLARHPEARAEIDAQRRLAACWERCPVPEPDIVAWDDALSRVESTLSAATAEPTSPQRQQGTSL